MPFSAQEGGRPDVKTDGGSKTRVDVTDPPGRFPCGGRDGDGRHGPEPLDIYGPAPIRQTQIRSLGE